MRKNYFDSSWSVRSRTYREFRGRGRGGEGGRVPTKKRLEEVRQALLALHKTLVDSERVTYEKTVGAIRSPNQFLQLLTTDPWFAWLQPLSQLIVSMDEAMDAKEPLTDQAVDAVVKAANVLLAPSEIGEGFAHHYFDALQRDPDVVIAHAEAMKLLAKPK
jgi:hypothetical protein